MELRTGWLGKGMSFPPDLLEPRLVQSHSTVIIPLYKRIVVIGLLNCSEFSSRLSKISQALDAITGIQFRVGSRGLDKRWPLGSVRVSRCSSMRQRRLRSFAQFGYQLIDTAHISLPQRLFFACSSARQVEHKLGKHGSADPNRSVLTVNFAAGSGLSRQVQTRERGASRSSIEVGHNDQFKNSDSRECNLKFLDLADCVIPLVRWWEVSGLVMGVVTCMSSSAALPVRIRESFPVVSLLERLRLARTA